MSFTQPWIIPRFGRGTAGHGGAASGSSLFKLLTSAIESPNTREISLLTLIFL